MKKITVLSILLFSINMLMGQTADTSFVEIRQETGQIEKQRWSDPYEHIFGTMESTRWLFSMGSPFLSNIQSNPRLLGAEVKILPGLSVHGSIGLGFDLSYLSDKFNRIDRYEPSSVITPSAAIEPRWYYDMPRRIKRGKSANNMSGNYIGLRATYKHRISNLAPADFIPGTSSVALRYGMQRRLFRFGVIDLGFGIGMQTNQWINSKRKWNVFGNSEVGLGLALAQPKTKKTEGGVCEVLRCFREERQLWKVDLYRLFEIQDNNDFNTGLSLGYERKIGDSPFSIEVTGGWSYQYYYNDGRSYGPYDLTLKINSWSGLIQPRYYYSQKRRIAKGKSGNNLSGAYIGAEMIYIKAFVESSGGGCGAGGCFPFNFRNNSESLGGSLLWGIQHRFFSHGFIDFSVGNSIYEFRYDQPRIKEIKYINPFARLRVGVAF